jgi:hypothetical protein
MAKLSITGLVQAYLTLFNPGEACAALQKNFRGGGRGRTSAKAESEKRELATGKSPEPAGRNACPTSAEPRRLAFDSLGRDSYGKHTAKWSLAGLEIPCTTLLRPGESYEKIRVLWPMIASGIEDTARGR